MARARTPPKQDRGHLGERSRGLRPPADGARELEPLERDVGRRTFLRDGALVVAAAGLGALGLRALEGGGPARSPAGMEGPPLPSLAARSSPAPASPSPIPSQGEATPFPGLHEASHYVRAAGGLASCGLCPHGCVLSPGQRGICRVRENVGGRLYTHGYGNPCSIQVDPIEKKPFMHFLPGTTAYSFAIGGCNLRCLNCQNWEISQRTPEEVAQYSLSPAQLAAEAKAKGCASIAYTYSEPSVWFEQVVDTAREARSLGVRSVTVTNGYLNREPLEELAGVLDAARVDLKAFSDETYRDLCSGTLQPVKDACTTLKAKGVWLEVVTLVVPGYTDGPDMLREMCAWLVRELGPDVPHHISRFHPDYRLASLPPTPLETLKRARDIARDAGERFVYVGNVPRTPTIPDPEDTVCPSCGRVVIGRDGYVVTALDLSGGACRFCGAAIPGVWA